MEKTTRSIPDDVKTRAHSAVMRSGAFSPLSQGDSHDAWAAVEFAAPIIAEWARKEALREAVEAVEGVEEVDNASDGDGGDIYWTIDPEPFADAIRALAEGGD